MVKSKSKRQRDIKSKLMAAICMLLVSSIMMVSSTYAWFTLSTAPEVTGIQTAVGANGNLEMALLPKSGETSEISSEAGDSVKDIEERNLTWGNLVTLKRPDGTSPYGLDQITLYPSELNMATATQLNTSIFLKTPVYGSDGRISVLEPKAVASYYNSVTGVFPSNDSSYGVRGLGSASGMTDRQLDYRNALSKVNTAIAQAKNAASSSLNTNGSKLANIAISYGMNGAAATFTQADKEALQTIVNDLLGTESKTGALGYIDIAYVQAILAYSASKATGTEDTVWSAVSGLTEGNAKLKDVKAGLAAAGISTIPEPLNGAITKYENAVKTVEDAQDLINGLTPDGDGKYTWTQISPILQKLANPTTMTVNNIAAGDVKEQLGDLVSSVTAQGGLTVRIASGGGVYADIADQCGNFTASVTIDKVEYQGIVLNNMNAKMAIDAINIFKSPIPTSRPSARTRALKFAMTSGFSGLVRNVATSHATVVTPMVHRSFS